MEHNGVEWWVDGQLYSLRYKCGLISFTVIITLSTAEEHMEISTSAIIREIYTKIVEDVH